MEPSEELYMEKEKLKHALKWMENQKKVESYIQKPEEKDFPIKCSQINEAGNKLLILDEKNTIKIYSIPEKKWEFSYVVTSVKSKIKCVSFTLWPNILAFVCEEGLLYLINIYSDEIFQEINIFPLLLKNLVFFHNPKANEHYSCAFSTENSQGTVVFYKILPKNRRPNRRNKLMKGHLKTIIAQESNDKYLATADQANILIIWELNYFEMLKSVIIPTEMSSENKTDIIFALRFHPLKKDIVFVAMDSGDIHELNIIGGELKTCIVSLGPQPSFIFDDGSFFLISFNSNLTVEFYKKELSSNIPSAFEIQNSKLAAPKKAKTHLNFKEISEKIQKNKNQTENLGFSTEDSNHLTLATNTKKPMLCLKLFESQMRRNFEWSLLNSSTYYLKDRAKILGFIPHKNVFFIRENLCFITVLSNAKIVYWKKTGEMICIFDIFKESEEPLSLIGIQESQETE